MPFFSSLKEKLTEYVETRLKLYQVSLEEKIVEMVSNAVLFIIILGIVGLALIFTLIFLATLINHFVGYGFVGYGIIALICNFMFVFFTRKGRREYFVNRIKELVGENIKSKKDGGKDDGSV